MRHRGGQGSYDTIVPKFPEGAREQGSMNYYVRGTFTEQSGLF